MLLDALRRDLALALRLLRRRPAYASASALTLALGMATTTAIFAVIDATFLRPLPFADPDRLVALSSMMPGPNGGEIQYALTEIEIVRWRQASPALSAVGALQPRSMALTGAGEPEVVRGAAVTSNLFDTLGVAPARGRVFSDEEEARRTPVAVLGDRLWRRRFGERLDAIGASIALDGREYVIVGVMPPGFRPLLDGSEVWVPLSPSINPSQQSARMTAGVARLARGATIAQAEAELAAVSAQLAREFPAGHGKAHPEIIPLRENLFGPQRPALAALAAGVALLLLLACANVANLTLGHLAERRSELAMRALLGAAPWRLALQQLAQTLLLSAAGSALGVALVMWTLPPLVSLYARDPATMVDVRVDWRVLLFSAATMVLAAAASGVLPALSIRDAGARPLASLATTRIGIGRRERRLRTALVAVQIAIAVALLCAAGTLAISFERILSAPHGFRADGVLTMQMMLPPVRYGDVRARADIVERFLQRIARMPAVVAVGTTQTTFMPNESMQTGLFTDRRPVDPSNVDTANIRHVTPGYFAALRVPIVAGRPIDDRDRMDATPVCMVSADFARQFWPNQAAVGHRVRRAGATSPWMTVVGVAADVMDAGAGVKPGPTLYVPYLQNNTATARVTLVVAVHGDPLGAASTVRQAIWSIDPNQPVDRIGRLTDVLTMSAGDQRFRTVLIALFAASGLALALVGVYGVTAAAVSARRWEAGVRLALGARPAMLVVRMFGESMAPVAAGALIGVIGFAAFGRLLSQLLYETSAADPAIVVAAIASTLAAAAAAAWLQARLIAGVQPRTALDES